MPSTRYVRETGEGRWDVLQKGQRRSMVSADSKSQAISRARDQVRREGGGEVRVINEVGKVADTRPVSKPRRTRKHQ